MSRFETIFLVVFYMLIGYCLAVPYLVLSGGTSEQQLLVTGILAPLFVLFIASAYICAYKQPRPGSESMCKQVFFIFLAYTLLPIVMNVISIILRVIGFENLSESFFALRFWILLLLPLGMLVLLILFSFLGILRQFVRNVRS